MNRSRIRAALTWGVAATLLLPVVLAVVVGLGSLLGAVGDTSGARACGRVALAAAAVWIVAIVMTTAASAVALLDDDPRPPPGRRRIGRRRRRLREPRDIGPEQPRVRPG